MRTLKLGPLELETPVLSAPIAGFTDSIYRRTVRDLGGCGLMFTEMVWAGGWVQAKIDPDRLAGVVEEARPLGVQLWDRDPELIEEAARRLAEMRVSLIDLNFGCPKKRIMGRHAAGASLLRDPATVGRLVAAAVRGAGTIPVTAKIRLGPSLAARTAPDVARSIEDNGAVGITVHGRTADQHYGEPCHLDSIGEVVRAVAIPVIANGDVHDAASALRTIEATGAAGVMVARAALTRPWIFREISAALCGIAAPSAPTAHEQKSLLLKNHAALVDREGDPRGTILMRKFACRYIAGAPGTHAFRAAITRAQDSADFREIVERLFPLDDASFGERPADGALEESVCG